MCCCILPIKNTHFDHTDFFYSKIPSILNIYIPFSFVETYGPKIWVYLFLHRIHIWTYYYYIIFWVIHSAFSFFSSPNILFNFQIFSIFICYFLTFPLYIDFAIYLPFGILYSWKICLVPASYEIMKYCNYKGQIIA